MLSSNARRLLGIRRNAILPAGLGELYDHYFAGRSYKTRFQIGWTFTRRGEWQLDSYDVCLERYTAQFNFGLDPECGVYVQCNNWIPIASSIAALVETDAVLAASRGRPDKLRGLGRFPSHDEFISQYADYLSCFQDISPDPKFTRILQGPESIVVAFRFYLEEPTFNAVEYYF
jgi:hypothetical protein